MTGLVPAARSLPRRRSCGLRWLPPIIQASPGPPVSGWASYGGQHGNFEVSEVEKILREMSRLARMADAEQAGVYFWMR
jgi:hypothetical protein